MVCDMIPADGNRAPPNAAYADERGTMLVAFISCVLDS